MKTMPGPCYIFLEIHVANGAGMQLSCKMKHFAGALAFTRTAENEFRPFQGFAQQNTCTR